MYVSLKDVAARAGVSFQTASKVLNGQKGVVAERTQERILAAAAELGYVPNAVARSLVTKSTYAIGIVADDLSDWVLAQFVVAAEREARRRGHVVLIVMAHSSAAGHGSSTTTKEKPESYVRLLLERRVDGIITAAPSLEHDRAVARLLRNRVPAVSMHHVPGGGVPVVGSDHARTGQLATEHLIQLGHRRIGTITGPMRRRVVASRLRGYRAALEAAGIPVDESLVVEAGWDAQAGYDATCTLLERAPDVTAIFAQNDLLAIGVLSALDHLGRRVPQDCSVVGCDDLPQSAHLRPPLTSVHVPFYETGERAVALLLERIQSASRNSLQENLAEPPQRSVRTLLPVHLVERQSTAVRGEST